MARRFIQLFFLALFVAGLLTLTKPTQAQTPTLAPLYRPDYNYSEASSCTRCHFMLNPDGTRRGPHMIEAVGVVYDETKNALAFSGNGWLASKHAQSNYKSTQDTYCAKCHSPLQATADAQFKMGKSQPIPDGKVEGVTCAVCHPSHDAAITLGRRLGIYKWGMDKAKAEAYDVVHEGEEDVLCLSCHMRHNEQNPAFDLMFVAGVRCMDCHMAPYGKIPGTEIDKRFHDFKVAKNMPYSCGVEGSVIHCHPGFSSESTLALIPYMKEQHRTMWPDNKTTRKLRTAADYLRLWKQLEAEVQK